VRELAAREGVERPEDWRRVTYRQACAGGGGGLLMRYGGSLTALLQDTLPAADWAAYEAAPAARVARGYWRDQVNQQAFLVRFAADQGIDLAPYAGEGPPVSKEESREIFTAWGRVPATALAESGGKGLLGVLGDSMAAALAAAFPRLQMPAAALRRRRVWASREQRQAFLRELAAAKGLDASLPESWRSVSYADVVDAGGKGLLNRYDGSVFRLLCDSFPEMDLAEPECRERVSRGHWAARENRLAFLAKLREEHGIASPEDWRDVTTIQVRELPGGSGFLSHYGNNFFAALSDLLADKQEEQPAWQAVKQLRPVLPQRYWQDEANVKAFVKHCEEALQLERPEDWRRVSRSQLVELGGATLLHRTRLEDVLQRVYPDENWDRAALSASTKRASQRLLSLLVGQVIPEKSGANAAP